MPVEEKEKWKERQFRFVVFSMHLIVRHIDRNGRMDEQKKEGMATVKDAAEFLNLHPETVKRMVDRGEIFVRRYGRTVRIPWRWIYEQVET